MQQFTKENLLQYLTTQSRLTRKNEIHNLPRPHPAISQAPVNFFILCFPLFSFPYPQKEPLLSLLSIQICNYRHCLIFTHVTNLIFTLYITSKTLALLRLTPPVFITSNISHNSGKRSCAKIV